MLEASDGYVKYFFQMGRGGPRQPETRRHESNGAGGGVSLLAADDHECREIEAFAECQGHRGTDAGAKGFAVAVHVRKGR